MFEQFMTNPEQITFPVLFVGLLIYSMKTNDNREKRYQETIQENHEMVKNALKALRGYDEVKEKVDFVEKDVKKILDKVG